VEPVELRRLGETLVERDEVEREHLAVFPHVGEVLSELGVGAHGVR
jgi:hypothetical protein